MTLTHLSLFSGIGGIDLAAEWAGFETVGQCEFADYPTKVLEKHWPDVPRWRDVRDVTAESVREKCGGEITFLSGGFPCQPHSFAEKRLASGDERDLWGEFARVICEIKPRWVLAENVSGLLTSESGRFFGRVLRDLATMGYRVGWGSIRASWVGAVHRRERIFIIAYSYGRGLEMQNEIKKKFNQANFGTPGPTCGFSSTMGVQKLRDIGEIRESDGVPKWMDRLKCLGNAVVPQQVYPILKAIEVIENDMSNLQPTDNTDQ